MARQRGVRVPDQPFPCRALRLAKIVFRWHASRSETPDSRVCSQQREISISIATPTGVLERERRGTQVISLKKETKYPPSDKYRHRTTGTPASSFLIRVNARERDARPLGSAKGVLARVGDVQEPANISWWFSRASPGRGAYPSSSLCSS